MTGTNVPSSADVTPAEESGKTPRQRYLDFEGRHGIHTQCPADVAPVLDTADSGFLDSVAALPSGVQLGHRPVDGWLFGCWAVEVEARRRRRRIALCGTGSACLTTSHHARHQCICPLRDRHRRAGLDAQPTRLAPRAWQERRCCRQSGSPSHLAGRGSSPTKAVDPARVVFQINPPQLSLSANNPFTTNKTETNHVHIRSSRTWR